MKKGDIVLIPFPFTNLVEQKIRPALILVNNQESLNIIVAFITTNLTLNNKYDLFLSPNLENRLKKESIIKINKLATIDKTLIIALLGNINVKEIIELDKKLIELFKIQTFFKKDYE